MSKKHKTLLAAFASASMVVSTPVFAANPPSQPVAEAMAQNDNQCYIPPHTEGGRIYRDRSCAKLSDFLKNPEEYNDAKMYASLMALYNSSAFGKEMLENAARDGYRICDMELSPTVAAVQMSDKNKIGVDYSREKSMARYVSHLIHELAHYYQHKNGTEYFNIKRTVVENQRAMLSMETAAPVTEVIGLFLAGQAGTIDWRKDLHPDSAKYHYLVEFEERYDAEMHMHNDHNRALNEAAKEVWQTILQSQFRLDFYNSSAVRYAVIYLDNLNSSMGHPDTESVNKTIDRAGRMGANINFTSVDTMPSSDALFGESSNMRELFQAVEWHRQSRIWGKDNPHVQRNYQILVQNKNKYITVDINDAKCKLSQGMSMKDAFNPAVPRNQAPIANLTVTYKPIPADVEKFKK